MLNTNYEMFKGMIVGKKVAVLGLGISNMPAVRFLQKHGAVVTGCDKRNQSDFTDQDLENLTKYCSNLKLGDNYLDDLTKFDIVLKSPGISPRTPQIKKAIEEGVVITSEMELFMSLCPCKIIGITGSDGKTTTTTLIYEMLKADGRKCYVGGNIGSPLLEKLDYINQDDCVVLELSSFQLLIMGVSPDISVITNITPNHLDYHKEMSEYIEAKANIFKYHNSDSKLVINEDNSVTASFAGKQKGKLVKFSRKSEVDGAYLYQNKLCYNGDVVMTTDDIKIRGVHNVENYLAAIAALYDFVDKESMVKVARSFGGVEHRQELVRTINGIDFYNDAIASSPTRTMAALNTLGGKIVLIAGGKDKDFNYDELGAAIKDKVSAVVLCGENSQLIEPAIRKAYGFEKPSIGMLVTQSFEQAIKGAYAMAKAIDGKGERVSVILSPSGTSFDMFKNFEVKGRKYKEIVMSLI